jgi:hypothetical protein
VFGQLKLGGIDASLIEAHLPNRLRQRRIVHRKVGVVELGIPLRDIGGAKQN